MARLSIIGLGPGDPELMTPQAVRMLEKSTVLVGYAGYIELVPEALQQGKRICKTGMMGEMQRCAIAIEEALAGHETVIVCSGDPGVYAMAGLVFELLEEKQIQSSSLPVEVAPGVPAVCAAAALLGAPLMHDFACISLSDLLTPWELIQKRISHALMADFVLAVYNPRSKRRQHQLDYLLEEVKQQRGAQVPLGLVRNAYREEQHVYISQLATFAAEDVDMLSILLVGNSQTRIIPDIFGGSKWQQGARMLTPRGYMNKYR